MFNYESHWLSGYLLKIFFKTTLPLRVLNISYLREYITFVIGIGNIISIDHLGKQKTNFKLNLKLNLDVLLCSNPLLTVIIGDFNAKSKDWCSNDITSFEGSEHDFLTAQFELSQIINSHILKHKPTHILHNSRSFIDLIFTSQPNMVIESGLHAFFHSNCHHQIIYPKFDLKIFFPPPYEKTVRHFKHVKRATDIFD